MNDPVVEAIGKGILSSQKISFQYLRRFAGRDTGKWSELGRGREVLSTIEELDQYLYSYGPMICSQWQHLLDKVRIPDGDITLVDYGCGQGIATMLLIERFRKVLSDSVASLILIEPSLVALTRAEHILGCYLPRAEIRTVNKLLDDLDHDDLVSPSHNVKIHLFSNILDVEGFDQYTLFSDMFQFAGQHVVFAVGNDRNQHGGSDRLVTLYELMHDKAHKDWLNIQHSELVSFRTDRNKAAMCFYVELDVDGSV